jgi:hypothetical protein
MPRGVDTTRSAIVAVVVVATVDWVAEEDA